MNPDLAWAVWSKERQRRIEEVLERALSQPSCASERLRQAMQYAVLGGGKRVRPLLAYAAGEVVGAAPDDVDAPAAAVELIHAYSLVHDDLPCMDDDVLRRGKATCHVAYGEATALLAGDALQSLAFEVLASGRTSIESIALLAAASGASGMAGGQQVDLDAVGGTLAVDALESMHRCKTGALIRASILLGAMAGRSLNADAQSRLDAFARSIGLAFQVVDDVLDVESDASTLGKTIGKDVASGKPTYVTILGVEAARAHAARLKNDALSALSLFGTRARRLREIADWIVERKN